MEKESRRIGRFARDKKVLMATAGITAAMFFAGSDNPKFSEGHEMYGYAPVPQEEFKPVTIYEESPPAIAESTSPLPTPVIAETPKPTIYPEPSPTNKPKPTPTSDSSSAGWKLDSNVSWYGPGFYGHRTACGETLTKNLLGVANKTLPCGTMVDFKYKGTDGIIRQISVPVVDRGPYVNGRQWDLTGGLAVYLHHTFTGSVYYKVEK